ncbi:MAG: recombinase family protein [Singulisphaera sp.]
MRSRLGQRDDRPNLAACLKLRRGDVLVIWKLDRLGHDLRHLVNTVQDLSDRGVGLKVLSARDRSRYHHGQRQVSSGSSPHWQNSSGS